jgi:serine/threonine-protein kinase RsbW
VSIATAFGFQVPGTPEHVAEARHQLAAFLTDAGVPGDVVDNAVLAGCELVTNAVLHSASGLAGGKVAVHAVVAPYLWAQVDVCDDGPIPPDQERSTFQIHATGRSESGLGLFLVTGLSVETGAYDGPDGHVAWFRLSWQPAPGEGVVGGHG